MSRTLQQKNTRELLWRLVVILTLGSLLFFYIMLLQARHMQRELLELAQSNFRKAYFWHGNYMPAGIQGEYDIEKLDGAHPDFFTGEPADTILVFVNGARPFKKLSKKFSFAGQSYKLTTYVSSREISHLIIKVFLTEAFIFVLLLAVIIYTNRSSSARLWKPFRRTLQELGSYDITRNQPLVLHEQTGIKEFDELNAETSRLLKRVNTAYHNQKEFVGNASHEIQTPLAIIRSKLELLANQPGLTGITARLLSDITEANERLSQMNKNLLLLAKIGNDQFPYKMSIDMGTFFLKLLIISGTIMKTGFLLCPCR